MYIKKAAVAVAIVLTIVMAIGSTFASAAPVVLKKESRGNDVVSLQKNLIKLGYLSTNATGYFGNATFNAVKKLQKDNGLSADGIVGPKTYSVLDKLVNKTASRGSEPSRPSTNSSASTLLKQGDENDAVKKLQQSLIKLGYLNTDATGYFGPATHDAVVKLQRDNGLAADGIVGEQTYAAIDKMLNKAATASATASETKAATTSASTASANDANAGLLKEGDENDAVKQLQQDLISIGYLNTEATGYFGPATYSAVVKLQKTYGLAVDGIVGNSTLSLLSEIKRGIVPLVKPAAFTQTDFLLPWFTDVVKRWARGETATVYDIKTGKSFKVKRTYGTNHADCEPLTAADTAIMKQIYGGIWSWERRPVIVTVGNVKIAGSMTGYPHAGSDKYPANKVISSRSGGYGRGTNFDAVKGNNMNGHFDIHFYGSKNHYNNKVDSKHQAVVKEAAKWAEKHYN